MTRIALLFLIALPAFADQRIHLPNGGGCWQNDNGHVWGCSGGGGGGSGAAGMADRSADRAEAEARIARQKALQKCLRTADWPNQPGRAECNAMYGD